MENLLTILKLLEKTDHSVGKTFIQKSMYILKDGFDEKMKYIFKIHFYGPYSEDLANDIERLDDLGLIQSKTSNFMGYDIDLTESGKEFLNDFYNNSNQEEKINKIIELIGTESVKEMEIIGTVLFFAKMTSSDYEKTKNATKIEKSHLGLKDGKILDVFEKLQKQGLIT